MISGWELGDCPIAPPFTGTTQHKGRMRDVGFTRAGAFTLMHVLLVNPLASATPSYSAHNGSAWRWSHLSPLTRAIKYNPRLYGVTPGMNQVSSARATPLLIPVEMR